MKKIYDFLEIKVRGDKLRKTIKQYDFKKIPDSEKGSGKFNRSAKIGGWKENFDKKEQELMNAIMEKSLKEFGYECLNP